MSNLILSYMCILYLRILSSSERYEWTSPWTVGLNDVGIQHDCHLLDSRSDVHRFCSRCSTQVCVELQPLLPSTWTIWGAVKTAHFSQQLFVFLMVPSFFYLWYLFNSITSYNENNSRTFHLLINIVLFFFVYTSANPSNKSNVGRSLTVACVTDTFWCVTEFTSLPMTWFRS